MTSDNLDFKIDQLEQAIAVQESMRGRLSDAEAQFVRPHFGQLAVHT